MKESQVILKDNSALLKDNRELWSIKWIAIPFLCLQNPRIREEWGEDLNDVILILKEEEDYPKFYIEIICILKVLILVYSVINIEIQDLIKVVRKIN